MIGNRKLGIGWAWQLECGSICNCLMLFKPPPNAIGKPSPNAVAIQVRLVPVRQLAQLQREARKATPCP